MPQEANPDVLLDRAAATHDRLAARARSVDPDDIDAILCLTAAVVFHGIFEETAVFGHNEYVAPQAEENLAREHAEITEALALMEDLAENSPQSADLRALGRAVLDKVQQHIERDQRTLYGSLARLSAVSRGDSPK